MQTLNQCFEKVSASSCFQYKYLLIPRFMAVQIIRMIYDRTTEITLPNMFIRDIETEREALLTIYEPYVLKTAITFECEAPSIRKFKVRMEKVERTKIVIKIMFRRNA